MSITSKDLTALHRCLHSRSGFTAAPKTYMNCLEVCQMNCLRLVNGFTSQDIEATKASGTFASSPVLIRMSLIGGTDEWVTQHACHRTNCLFRVCLGSYQAQRLRVRDTWQLQLCTTISPLFTFKYMFQVLAQDQSGRRQLLAPARNQLGLLSQHV